MSQRMASERVAAQQYHINDQYKCTDADTKMPMAVRTGKKHCLDRIVRENNDEQQCYIEKISVYILQYQRKFPFAAVAVARLTYSTCRRVRPERFVICS